MIALLISGAVAVMVSSLGTRWLIAFLTTRGQSQPILQHNESNAVVPEHQHKSGTPTMGGLMIIVAALAGYLVSHLRKGVIFSDQTLVVIVGILVMAGIGFVDDYAKVRKRQNRGVFWKVKGAVTLLLSFAIAGALLVVTDIDTRLSTTRAGLPGWELGPVLWVLLAGLVIFATTNAVNVTDGLDGLASGSALLGFLAFTGIAYWGFRNPELYPGLVNPFDLAVLAIAFAGACGGFLWWNAAPARIFMGDVGALGLGAALALFALCTNTILLLPILCAVNVIEIGSVFIQMLVFRLSGRRKRLFRITPIHHSFEMRLPETTVIIRFWLIAGLSVMIALGLYLADFTDLAAKR